MSEGISVVVTTWNRQALLERALRSIRKAKKDHLVEVIVVDDASEVPADVSGFEDLNIQLIRHPENRGGGIARNTGIQASRFDWVAPLDDDDELLPEAFDILFKYSQCKNYVQETVLYFTYIQHAKKRDISRYFLKEYMNNLLEDFFCLINRNKWKEGHWSYPDLQIGGASLLWMKLALLKGIIVIDEPVAKVNYDATLRMCSVSYQSKYPASYMDFHRQEIEFIEPYRYDFRNFYKKKLIGYAIFAVFSDRQEEAKNFLKGLKNDGMLRWIALVVLEFPAWVLRMAFLGYRKLFSGF